MMGIAKKLKLLINGQSVNQWARDHDLPPQTVHEWIKMDRMPRSAGLKTLIEATGMPKKWWLHDEHHPVSTVNPLTTGSGQHSRLPVQSHSITDMRVNDFVPMPKYSLQSMPDRAISSDQVVDYLAFKKDWLQYSMDVHDQALALIKMKGDSMSPTLKNNDLMLTDLTQLRLEDDSIYVLSIKNELVVKRVQRKLNGAFVITTDNSQNQNTHQEEIDEETAMDLPVIGKVIWYGRVI